MHILNCCAWQARLASLRFEDAAEIASRERPRELEEISEMILLAILVIDENLMSKSLLSAKIMCVEMSSVHLGYYLGLYTS